MLFCKSPKYLRADRSTIVVQRANDQRHILEAVGLRQVSEAILRAALKLEGSSRGGQHFGPVTDFLHDHEVYLPLWHANLQD